MKTYDLATPAILALLLGMMNVPGTPEDTVDLAECEKTDKGGYSVYADDACKNAASNVGVN